MPYGDYGRIIYCNTLYKFQNFEKKKFILWFLFPFCEHCGDGTFMFKKYCFKKSPVTFLVLPLK